MALKETLKQKIEEFRPRTTKLTKEFGKIVIDQVTIDQAIGGARDVRCLVTDISYLDPQEGIRFRGKTIPETFEALPKAPGSKYPTVESFWYFLLTGDVPTQAQVDEVVAEWKTRQAVPQYVFDAIRALPRDSHPMVMLSVGLLALQKDSKFVAFYNSGKFNKMAAWEYVYEDASDIVARIPVVAAFIYNLKFRGDKQIGIDPALDMGANFAHMIGQSEEYKDVARMYFILHSDHESGNVSAHTTHLVHSALSDPYYAYSAGLNGLAGPLHGLANQEVLSWTMEFQKKYCADQEPTKELITKALWDTLNAGQVIPGYGHAVLRKTDPRYMSQREFCLEHAGPEGRSALQGGVDDLRGRAGRAHRARQDEEPVAERRRAVGRHPVVLRPEGMGLLHGPVRRRARAGLHGQHHLGPRPRFSQWRRTPVSWCGFIPAGMSWTSCPT